MVATKGCLSPDWGVWSLLSPQPETGLIVAGTLFENLTPPSEIEGVARPPKKIGGNDKSQNPNVK
jgi:hypothetical protein